MTIAASAIGQSPIANRSPAKKKPPPLRQMTAKLDVVAQPEPR
jgi:hypothetical protein